MRQIGLIAVGLFWVVLLGVASAAAETAKVELRNPQGAIVGSVVLTQEGGAVTVSVGASKLPPGFHGFHVHAVGKCEPPAFTSAGGHFNPAGQKHPFHAGDLPNLLVAADGTARMTVKTDRGAHLG